MRDPPSTANAHVIDSQLLQKDDNDQAELRTEWVEEGYAMVECSGGSSCGREVPVDK